MNWPPPRPRPLPPPKPVLWAPQSRRWLMRALERMDRRKAAKMAEQGASVLEAFWLRDYTEWWDEHGWLQGAPTPEQARHRRHG